MHGTTLLVVYSTMVFFSPKNVLTFGLPEIGRKINILLASKFVAHPKENILSIKSKFSQKYRLL